MISDYTIYCTEEQTRKAIELGASINNCPIMFAPEGIPKYKRQLRDGRWIAFPCPTAEQMLGYLREQKFKFSIDDYGYATLWRVMYDSWENHGRCGDSKEATLAAIDAALEFLTNNKK